MRSLKEIREERGMSQSEIAASLNLDERTYRRYENGERSPRYTTMKKLCHILGVTPLEVDLEIKSDSDQIKGGD